MDEREVVQTKFDMKKGNFIPNVYFEFETEKAVAFRRDTDDSITYIPKKLIKGGFHKKHNSPQDIKLMDYCTIKFYWNPY